MEANRPDASSSADAMSSADEYAAPARRLWLLAVVCGVGFIVLGLFSVMRSSESLGTVARIAGIAFVGDALLLVLLATLSEEWRGFYVLGGLIGVAGIALLLFFEDSEPFRLAIVLAGALAWRGLIDILAGWADILDFTWSRAPWGWTLFVVGITSIALALWAFISRGDAATALLVIVGVYAVARGVTTIAVSLRLRTLTRTY